MAAPKLFARRTRRTTERHGVSCGATAGANRAAPWRSVVLRVLRAKSLYAIACQRDARPEGFGCGQSAALGNSVLESCFLAVLRAAPGAAVARDGQGILPLPVRSVMTQQKPIRLRRMRGDTQPVKISVQGCWSCVRELATRKMHRRGGPSPATTIERIGLAPSCDLVRIANFEPQYQAARSAGFSCCRTNTTFAAERPKK